MKSTRIGQIQRKSCTRARNVIIAIYMRLADIHFFFNLEYRWPQPIPNRTEILVASNKPTKLR